MKIIASAWESYRRMVVPRDASPVQVNETRQAFYAGASILFTALTTAGGLMDENAEPTDSDIAKMAAIQAEVSEFGQHLDMKVFKTVEH